MSPEMVHSALQDAAQDVPADSSSALEGGQAADDHDDADLPDPGAGDLPGDASDGQGSKRTLENVRGELLRKVEKENATLRNELSEIKGMLQGMSAVSHRQDTGLDINNATVVQLKALRVNVPADKLEEFDKFVAGREQQETLRTLVAQEMDQRSTVQKRQEYNAQAYNVWPDLHDRTGVFYRTVNRILVEKGDAANHDPRAVLDAANSAGLELGIQPKTGGLYGQRTQHQQRGAHVNGRTSPSPDGQGVQGKFDPEIAAKLQSAMPGGQFGKDAEKRIAEGAKAYADNRHVVRKGGRL